MQLAQLFQLLSNGEDKQDLEIFVQAEAFVDDLLVVYKKHNSQHHFQLKTSPRVNWGNGAKSISDDFYKQKELNNALKVENTQVFLVCSSEEKMLSLKKCTPKSIIDFTDVIFFPEAETINQLLFIHEEFKTLMGNLCFSKDTDKLEALAKIILAHWVDKKTTLSSVNDLLSSLENIFPNFLAKTNVSVHLLPEVERIFSTIVHFSYKIEKGYFSWWYGECDSGSIPYSVDSKNFIAFQQEVASKRPRQFDELEGILL